nr:hypothetical protein [Tanacetum cinerariifolium]
VNIPRSDEDRLELMELTVFMLPKTTVAVKQVNDVTRLEALVDKKKVVVTEATIREALYLDDAEGVDCLPNKEIFAELARMGYEKPSTKLTRVGKGFSGVETPLFGNMLVEQEVDEEGDAYEYEVNAGDVADEVKDVEEAKVDESAQVQGRIAESQAEIYKIDMDHANKVLRIELHAELNKDIDWDEAINHVKRKAKEGHAVKRYQVLKRKPQTEAQARKNMIMYLKNVAGFKMDYFKGMSYDDIRPIFKAKFNSNVAFLLKTKEQIEEDENRALQKLNETPAERAAKRRKLDEEVEELKRRLQIVPDEDDDVYTEATPLARKVHVVDYKIIEQNNTPHYKIIGADDTHKLYIITFTSTQLILLVKRRYPLIRFTLDQMLNAVRLEVKE